MPQRQGRFGNQNERTNRKSAMAGLCVVAVSMLGVGVAVDAAGSDPVASPMTTAEAEVFSGISPVRLLDTRSGVGAPSAGPFGPGETRTLAAAGFEGVPSTATSIAVNVTLPGSATSSSFVTLWPAGSVQPDTSTSNATPGQAVPNFAITALGTGGAIEVFNERGNTHIVIDIVGYYVPLASGGTAASSGGALIMGFGAPDDDDGDNGDFYIEQVEADMYQKEEDTWGDPMIELATEADAMSGPHAIAADGPPAAADGENGDVYIDTAALEVYGPKAGGAWGSGQPIGPDGDGSAFLSAGGAPAAGLGSDGDLYLDSTNAVLYGPKASGAWGAGVDVGPDGIGSTLLTGAGAPGAGVGVDGDTYFDETNGVLYGPKSGTWGTGVDVGPDGVGSTLLTGAGAPGVGDGVDGDTYFDETNGVLYGPKSGTWGTGVDIGPDGVGSTLLTGAGAPGAGVGVDGDTYLDTTDGVLYGPKAGGAWAAGSELGGSEVLTGVIPPTAADGDDGDLYIDTVGLTLYGPKAAGAWPAASTDLDPGSDLLTGVIPPTAADGADGDVYVDTATLTVYGPKVGGVWPAGSELAPGIALLSGSGAPGPGDGEDGDMYLDPATLTLYGPKVGGVWPVIGSDLDGPPTASTDSAFSAYQNGISLSVLFGSSAAVPFATDGVAVGTAIGRVDSDTFEFNTSGTYRVTYSIDVAAGLLGSLGIEVDGSPVLGFDTVVDAAATTHAEMLVTATAGDELEIVLTSGLGGTADVGGSLIVELIAVA